MAAASGGSPRQVRGRYFMAYPILAYFFPLWLWRQLLWTRFMRATARLDLRLIAAHPDGLGGIGFVESAFRGQQPFCFCLGAGLAGAVANRMFHHGQKLTSFGEVAAVLVASVLLIRVAPYFVFTAALTQMRRSGLLRYGGFARAAGEHFEKKWLDQPDTLKQDILMVADFSAMHNLYGVVGNVNDVSVLPVSRVDLYGLFAAAFAARNSRGSRFGSIRCRCPGSREAAVLRSDAAVAHCAGLR